MMLGIEFLMCVVTAFSLYFFAHGCTFCFRKMDLVFGKKHLEEPTANTPTLVWLSLGLLGLVALSGLLTEMKVQGVFIAEAVFWLVAVLGAKPGLKSLAAPFWKDPTRTILVTTGVFYVAFWLIQFRGNVGLPSRDDGVAHLSWLVDVHRTGFAHLAKVPVHFEGEFGRSLNPFYPTGMQALIATVSGVWIRLGILPTTILKIWLILTHTGLLLTLLWALQRHWKNISVWKLVVVAMVASTAFRIPMDASSEGGLARIVAFAAVFPFCFYIAANDEFSLRQLAVFGVVGFVASFLLHPSAFWLFGLSLGFAAIFEWKRNGFKISRDVVYFAGACVLGAVALGWLLYSNRTLTTPTPYVQNYVGLGGLFKKLNKFFQILLAGTYAPKSIVRPLFHVGIVGVWWLAKKGVLSGRVVMYHLMLVAFALLVMATDVYRFPGASAIGGAFYYEPARTACLLYLTVWIFVLASVPVIQALVEKIFALVRGPRARVEQAEPRLLEKAFPVAWIVLAAAFQIANWFSTPRVMDEFDTAFKTPKWKNLGDLAKFVEGNTPTNAVIAGAPFDADVLGPLTGRQSLFIYGDFVPGRDANAIARVTWFNEKEQRIKTLLADPNTRKGCDSRALVAPFTRPVVFIVNPFEEAPRAGEEICAGLRFEGRINDRFVFSSRL
jgi:hypothetical protein